MIFVNFYIFFVKLFSKKPAFFENRIEFFLIFINFFGGFLLDFYYFLFFSIFTILKVILKAGL